MICNPLTGSYFDDKADGYKVDLTDSTDYTDEPNSSTVRSRRNVISSENGKISAETTDSMILFSAYE